MTYYTVYQITNLINGKIYVGKHNTNNPYDNYLGTGTVIDHAVKKHGKENFKKEILYIFNTEQEAYDKEEQIVDKSFIGREDTYNLIEGGRPGGNSEYLKSLWEDPEYREKMSKIRKEVSQRQDVKENISKSSKKMWEEPGRTEERSRHMTELWGNPEFKETMFEAQRQGRTEETKQKQSEASQKMWEDPEKRKIHSELIKSKWQEPEYRKTQIENLKSNWQDPETRERIMESRRKVLDTPEYSLAQSERSAKIWKDPETKEGRSKKMRNKRWIHNNQEGKTSMIDKELPLPDGWTEGRGPKT